MSHRRHELSRCFANRARRGREAMLFKHRTEHSSCAAASLSPKACRHDAPDPAALAATFAIDSPLDTPAAHHHCRCRSRMPFQQSSGAFNPAIPAVQLMSICLFSSLPLPPDLRLASVTVTGRGYDVVAVFRPRIFTKHTRVGQWAPAVSLKRACRADWISSGGLLGEARGLGCERQGGPGNPPGRRFVFRLHKRGLSLLKIPSARVSIACAADSRPDTELLYHPSLARSH